MTTDFRSYDAASLQVRVLAPASKPRSTGGVRLFAGGILPAPSGPAYFD